MSFTQTNNIFLNGATGPQGVVGQTGSRGVTGSIGPQGVAGSTGPRGATGIAGPQGAHAAVVTSSPVTLSTLAATPTTFYTISTVSGGFYEVKGMFVTDAIPNNIQLSFNSVTSGGMIIQNGASQFDTTPVITGPGVLSTIGFYGDVITEGNFDAWFRGTGSPVVVSVTTDNTVNTTLLINTLTY